MDIRYEQKPHLRQATIRPLPKRRGETVVSQSRIGGPHVQGGWGQPHIAWASETDATAEETDLMIFAFAEAGRIYREWARDQ